MTWIKGIFVSLGILVVVSFGGFVLYHVAHTLGEAEGYDTGYSAGQGIGYSEGYELGRTEGYEQGYDECVQVGLEQGYTLRDPTYSQAVAFLSRDRTDRNEYDEDTYVCSHFARDVCNSAEAEGWRCAFVELRHAESGHSIVAFDTIDRGLVYFEPQFDDEVEVVMGQSYSQLNDYQLPLYDDIIMDILIIW